MLFGGLRFFQSGSGICSKEDWTNYREQLIALQDGIGVSNNSNCVSPNILEILEIIKKRRCIKPCENSSSWWWPQCTSCKKAICQHQSNVDARVDNFQDLAPMRYLRSIAHNLGFGLTLIYIVNKILFRWNEWKRLISEWKRLVNKWNRVLNY